MALARLIFLLHLMLPITVADVRQSFYVNENTYEVSLDGGANFLCHTGFTAIMADFNGDGRADLFCDAPGTSADELYIASISGQYYAKKSPELYGWCPSSEGVLITGDVNGDGYADLICRFTDGTRFQVSYFSHNRFLSPGGLKVTMECPLTSELYIGDVTGEHMDDFVCYNPTSGVVRIYFNNGKHYYSQRFRRHDNYDPRIHHAPHGYHELETPFCVGSGTSFRIGDFNGDGRQDLLCYEDATGGTANGQIHIAYADLHGHFDERKKFPLPVAPRATSANDVVLYVADLNGDKLSDLVFTADPNTAGTFDSYDVFYIKPLKTGMVELSHPPAASPPFTSEFACMGLVFADNNGDGMDDLLCVNTATGVQVFHSATFAPPSVL